MSATATFRQGQPALLLGLLALLLGVLAPPRAAQAHALDEYLLASYITIAPEQITVELKLAPGALVAPEVLAALDPDGEQQLAATDGRAYADEALRQVVLELDGEPLALQLTDVALPPYLNLQTGYGEIRVTAIAALPANLTGTQLLTYANAFAPTGAKYQVNAFVAGGAPITLGVQRRDDRQQRLNVDVTSAVAAPVMTQSAAVPVADPAATALSAPAPGEPAGALAQVEALLGYLRAPTTAPWAVAGALVLAALLGGLHALTPGHGKTLVAAYLVGSRGTVRDAVLLGGTVTLAHTASVLLFGVLALVASQAVAATTLAVVLELVAALLVVGLGVRLAGLRWRELSTDAAGGVHGHSHPHIGERTGRPGGIIGLGLAGGALPCPEALAILLVAVGLGRIGLGLGLIVSFSLGLAAVLITLGVLLVRAEARLQRFARLGTAWQRWLPLASAVVVLLLGLGLLLNGLRKTEVTTAAALIVGGGAALLALGYGLGRRTARRTPPQRAGAGVNCAPSPTPWLPPRYQSGQAVSAAPMGAAPLQFDATGAVAWDAVWTDFCDVALAGGPPHRGTCWRRPTPNRCGATPRATPA